MSITTRRVNEDTNTLDRAFTRAFTLNWEVIAYVVILLLAIFTRFYMLGERVMSHDESLHTVFSNNLYQSGDFEHQPMMHGPILFHMTALSYALFGVNDFTARIYTAVVGVLVVMFPLLFRRWIGRLGAILASVLLLVSPMLMYYSRYIRHDLPSILSALVMFWAAMMYLSGPENQRRRAHWLYILSGAMLWNLGSKETAFIYIAVFGAFLTLYWLVRMAQHFYRVNGRPVFDVIVVGILLAGVLTLAMIVVNSISLSNFASLGARLDFLGGQFGALFSGESLVLDFTSFVSWTGLALVTMLALVIVPALWVYRRGSVTFSWFDVVAGIFVVLVFVVVTAGLTTQTVNPDSQIATSTAGPAIAVGLFLAISLLLIYGTFRFERVRQFRNVALILLAIMLVVCGGLLLFEELSHVPSRADETAAPAVPGQQGAAEGAVSGFTVGPLVLVWVLALVAIGGMIHAKRRGWWAVLDFFPEFDILIVMGSLVFPWLTAFITNAMSGSPADYAEIGASVAGLSRLLPVDGAEQIGRVIVGFIAWVPVMAVTVVAGLFWNWRRWLISAAVFYTLFAFFFTTVFTNIEGLASGMVYSLQYWLEQQGVRRANQPQYYYLLVILPFYEFLAIIGSVLAMLAGMLVFWRRRRAYEDDQEAEKAADYVEIAAAGNPTPQVVETAGPSSGTSGVDSEERVEALVEQRRAEGVSRWLLCEVPFLLFAGWWAVWNLIFYTLAGEKMPWLATHLTVPMILLAGWYFGRVIERIEWRRFLDQGWIYLLLLPLLFIAIFRIVAPYFSGQPPFSGTQSQQLEWTYNWLAVVGIGVAVLYVVSRLADRTGWSHLRRMLAVAVFTMLALFTFRSAWLASFIHFDEATEFLVYAHGGPGNRIIIDDLRELSLRITGGMDIRVIHDDRFSWPGSWYLRDFAESQYLGSNAPTVQQVDEAAAIIVGSENRAKYEPLVEDRFQRFDYVRMWWPMQDYFGLNAERVSNLLDLSNAEEAGVRRGIFDIWWSRDYSTYSDAVNRSITLENWPLHDTVHFYVRKDYAAQIWPYGVGDATVLNPFTEVDVNTCTANWQPRAANVVFDTSVQTLVRPLGLDVHDDLVYVAEEGNHRITIFDMDGNLITSFGHQGLSLDRGAAFERPHSVAVGPEDNIYVVDTWNYKVRTFTADREFITSWGQPITAGAEAQTEPVDGFWGPRDIAVDSQGRVYVADTGNKRIRVYDSDGTFLYDIGTAGEGRLNEPAGIALHPDGRLFVADMWNRRVAVFNQDGSFIRGFEVRGWYDQQGTRPYLAVDSVRELVYVADPDAGRILIYDTDGNCLSSFGQFNDQSPNSSQFTTVGGIAVDENGYVYVTDYATGRVLKFDPYERPEPALEDAAGEIGPIVGDQVEVSPEVSPEASAEVTDEIDAASPAEEVTEEVESQG